MRKRHHSGQSPARQYFYLHTAILRRALEFIPTLTTPQFDQFDVPITNISIYTKIYTQTGSFYMHLNSNRPKHKRQNQTRWKCEEETTEEQMKHAIIVEDYNEGKGE